jgi:hypothetical protein
MDTSAPEAQTQPDQQPQLITAQPAVPQVSNQITPEKTGKKHMVLFFIGAIVIALLIGGVYIVVSGRTSVGNLSVKPYNSYQPTVSPVLSQSANTSNPTSNNDQQLDKDMQSVDNSMTTLSQDEKNSDQGLHDQPANLN